MSQRGSGYERKENDLYETPVWATEALFPHIPNRVRRVLEPAAGTGKMLHALQKKYEVEGRDITTGLDFLKCGLGHYRHFDAIITNPPYALATEFIKHALDLSEAIVGVFAMLLRTDFDHAKSREGLFSACPAFAKKLVLTKRIKWFDTSTGSPSFNHAWFIWDWRHSGEPVLAYDFQ